MLEEKRLIWKLKRGSLDAFRQVYDKYRNALLKVAVSLTGDGGRSEDAGFLKTVLDAAAPNRYTTAFGG